MDVPHTRDYLTADYSETIAEHVDGDHGYAEDEVRAIFEYDCEKFDELFDYDKPLSTVRSIAWKQTKHRLSRDDIPDDLALADQ